MILTAILYKNLLGFLYIRFYFYIHTDLSRITKVKKGIFLPAPGGDTDNLISREIYGKENQNSFIIFEIPNIINHNLSNSCGAHHSHVTAQAHQMSLWYLGELVQPGLYSSINKFFTILPTSISSLTTSGPGHFHFFSYPFFSLSQLFYYYIYIGV